MKAFKLFFIVCAAAAIFSACGKNNNDKTPLEPPVITSDMFSVTADDATMTVSFVFNAADLTPFWKVNAPDGTAVDLGANVRNPNFSMTFQTKGLYSGSVIGFGAAGQSAPVQFTFSLGGSDVSITDPDKSITWNILVSKTWKLSKYGYWGPDWEEADNKLSLGVPSMLADDRLTFGKDGKFTLDLGANKTLYDDSATGGVPTFTPTATGNEKWELKKDGDAEYVQFSGGGFPSMLFGEGSVNARWDIYSADANQVRIQYQFSEGEFIVLFLVDENTSTGPENPDAGKVDAATVEAFIKGKSFKPSRYGWWGEGWDALDNDVPEFIKDDKYTFSADGKFVMDLGEDNHVLNDRGPEGGEEYTPTGKETWEIKSDSQAAYISFGGGGFPGAIAGIPDKLRNGT